MTLQLTKVRAPRIGQTRRATPGRRLLFAGAKALTIGALFMSPNGCAVMNDKAKGKHSDPVEAYPIVRYASNSTETWNTYGYRVSYWNDKTDVDRGTVKVEIDRDKLVDLELSGARGRRVEVEPGSKIKTYYFDVSTGLHGESHFDRDGEGCFVFRALKREAGLLTFTVEFSPLQSGGEVHLIPAYPTALPCSRVPTPVVP